MHVRINERTPARRPVADDAASLLASRHQLPRRIWSIYLWLGLPLMLFMRIALPRAGYAVLALVGLAHASVIAVAATRLSRARKAGGRADDTAALLLLLGPAIFVLGAATGAPNPANAEAYVWNTAGLLLGSLIALAGFVAICATLVSAGARLAASLTFAAILLSTALWLPSLALRVAVLATGSGESWAALDQVYAHFRQSNLPLSEFADSWRAFLLVLTYVLSTLHKVLLFLACACAARALRRAGLISGTAGRVITWLSMALAVVVLAGRFLWAAPVIATLWALATIPFAAYVLLYFLGTALLRAPSSVDN
jgi:hypothetical protein